jgi:hypothetical protein
MPPAVVEQKLAQARREPRPPGLWPLMHESLDSDVLKSLRAFPERVASMMEPLPGTVWTNSRHRMLWVLQAGKCETSKVRTARL